MTSELNSTIVLDEIDRLFVVYDKAKEYINRILLGIDQQVDLWQYRRQIILEQMRSSTSFDFLLPKTQRLNELTIDAVQALCRVDLIIEQILRIDPKSSPSIHSTPKPVSFSTRSLDRNSLSQPRHTLARSSLNPINEPQSYASPISNGNISVQTKLPMPVIRSSQGTLSNRVPSVAPAQEKSGFKPIEQQRTSIISDNASRPTPIHPQMPHFIHSLGRSHEERTSQSDYITSPMTTTPGSQTMSGFAQTPRGKVQVKLQRITPGTRWKQAKIEVIDSLSAFYALNCEQKVHEKFDEMLNDLHEYYCRLEATNTLIPLEQISIGDFGVAKYSEDRRWYRARIIMCEGHDHIRIVYIDFGNIETIDNQEFFPLEKSFTDLPAQAIACTLSEAYPRVLVNDSDSLWPPETIQVFRDEVENKIVEVHFLSPEEGTEQWPLHFVKIIVGNQTVTNLLNLKQHIEPKPNHFIAGQLASCLKQEEYILFNVPISSDE